MQKTRLSSTRIPSSLSIGSGAIVFLVGTVRGPNPTGTLTAPSASGALRGPGTVGTVKG